MITPTGAERMTFEVLGELRAQGAEVHCILSGWESRQIEPMAERIGATWSAGGSYVKFNRHTRSPASILRQTWDVLVTSAHLLREAVRFRPTHVLLPDHLSVVRNYPALVLIGWCRVDRVTRLCNAPDQSPFYRWLWRRVIDSVTDRFVCESDFTRRELLAHGIDADKTVRISNVPPYRPPHDCQVARIPGRVIYVGQIIPPKGLHVLLDAIALLRARGLEATLDVVGRIDGWLAPEYGDYWDEIRTRAAAPDLSSSVRLLGWREDVDLLMRQASVHCCPSLPSLRESFGLVVLEAKMAGIPSVVLQSGALSEHITHGNDGWVCAEPTPTAVAEGLQHFLGDSRSLERASAAARESAGRYSREAFAAGWWAVLAESHRPGASRVVTDTMTPADRQ